MKKLLTLTVVAGLLTIVTATTQAQYTNYRSTNAFFNALASTNYSTETFSGLTPGYTNNPLNVTNSPYGFQANVSGSSFISVESFGGKPALSTIATAQLLSFTNLSPNTRAFGAYLYATENFVLEAQPITISLVFSGGATNTFTTNVGTTSLGDYYFGFITEEAFTLQSVTLSVTNNQAFATASEVTISTVPEPSTYALIGLAAAALAGQYIRRRRA